MKIELDDDTADAVVQESLVETYKSLKRDLKVYKNNKAHLHEDDVEIYKTVADAIEIVARWYFAHGEFEKRVKRK
jgi:hypothetical protein